MLLFVCQLLASFTSFGQLLRRAHKGIVNIMKVHIERNNMQVELIRFRNIDFIDVGNFEVGMYFCDRRVCETGLMAIRDVSPLFCAGSSQEKSVQHDSACSISANSNLICYSSLRF